MKLADLSFETDHALDGSLFFTFGGRIFFNLELSRNKDHIASFQVFFGERNTMRIDDADVEPIRVFASAIAGIGADTEVGEFVFVLRHNFRVFADISNEVELVHSAK